MRMRNLRSIPLFALGRKRQAAFTDRAFSFQCMRVLFSISFMCFHDAFCRLVVDRKVGQGYGSLSQFPRL